MRNFVIKLVMAVLPLLIYIIIFIVYEPYNYWGIKPLKSGKWATPLARVREFQRNPSENLILGDSRMNHFDLDTVEEMTGCRYANLSTGGQGLNLSKELYDWAKSQTAIKNVIIDASFYQIRRGSESPSAQSVFKVAEQPLVYITTRDYVVEAFELFVESIRNKKENTIPITENIETKESNKYREDLRLYALENIYPSCQDYTIGQEQMNALIYIVQDTRANNGEPLIVCPPVQESIWDYVIFPLELEDELEKYKTELQQYSVVYDMEWISDFAKNQDIYSDGFHFMRGDGYKQFERAIFVGDADFLHMKAYQP